MKSLKIIPLIIAAVLIVLGCTKESTEEVISTYPDGAKKETAFFSGEKPNRLKIKSFEYYATGEKKVEYNYKENNFFGDWAYWYKNGAPLARGNFTDKTLDPFGGFGKVTYLWPDGNTMMEVETVLKDGQRAGTTKYFDRQGNNYLGQNLPDQLRKDIHLLLSRWDRGEI